MALRATRLVPRAALARAHLKVLRADFDAEVTLRRTEAAPDLTDAFTLRETKLLKRNKSHCEAKWKSSVIGCVRKCETSSLANAALVWQYTGMPKLIKHLKRRANVKRSVRYLVEGATSESDAILPPTRSQISSCMAAMGRKGGRIGGKRRLETMTAAQRSAAARKAAEARWKKS